MSTASGLKILVLGGTGFVGSRFIELALSRGHSIVSVSRRGAGAAASSNITAGGSVKYVQGDATDANELADVIKFEGLGSFDACFHSIGLLFDSESGLGSYNRLISGVGSVPRAGDSYDKVTTTTAFNAIDILCSTNNSSGDKKQKQIPFVFISAAEAGWSRPAPIGWLERYLVSKRVVETRLLSYGAEDSPIRPVILRPGLIYDRTKTADLFKVAGSFVGYFAGLPFVSKPIEVRAVAAAALRAFEEPSVRGIQTHKEMEREKGR